MSMPNAMPVFIGQTEGKHYQAPPDVLQVAIAVIQEWLAHRNGSALPPRHLDPHFQAIVDFRGWRAAGNEIAAIVVELRDVHKRIRPPLRSYSGRNAEPRIEGI